MGSPDDRLRLSHRHRNAHCDAASDATPADTRGNCRRVLAARGGQPVGDTPRGVDYRRGVIDPRSGPARVLRAWALAATATAVGAVAHESVAGPASTPVGPLLALALVSLVVAAPLTARRLRAGTVTTFLALDQAVVHVVMSGHHAPGTTAGGASGHHHALAGAGMALLPVEHTLSWSMVGAHLAAALLVGLLWSRGEAWLWRIVAWLRLPLPHAPRPGVRLPAPGLLTPLTPLEVVGLALARGPPVRSLPTT